MWFLGSDNAAHYTPPPEAPKPAKGAGNEPVNVDSAKPVVPEKVVVTEPKPEEPKPAPAPIVLTEDDRKIDEALRLYPGNSDQDHLNTAQALINLLPSLTKDGQVEASQHIVNLLPDEQWSKVNHIWRNPAFNEDVIEVLTTDLFNRDDKVKLPALLDAIRIPNHHAREEAKTTLQVFLDEDYGDDVGKWDAAMKAYLKKIDDEEKEANAAAPK